MESMEMVQERTLEAIEADAAALGVANIGDAMEVYKKMIALTDNQDALYKLSNLAREYETKLKEHPIAA